MMPSEKWVLNHASGSQCRCETERNGHCILTLCCQYSSETSGMAIFLSFAPTLLLIGAFLFAARRMGGAGGGGSGHARAVRDPVSIFNNRRDAPAGPGGIFKVGKANPTIINKEMDVNIMFKDVAGLQEAKTEIMEFVSFLKARRGCLPAPCLWAPCPACT